jgi:pimeloyl-ACP methyl ester carboxylesterase
MIGIDLAARYPSVPLAVVAVDPGPIDPLPAARTLFAELLDALRSADAAAKRRAYVEEMFLPHDDLERASRIADTMCAVPIEVATAVIEGVVAWDGADALRRCDVPLLVVRSVPGGSNDAARLLPLKPDLRYGVTVGAGHFHQLDVPEQVTPMIERFVRIVVAETRQPAGVGG